MAFNKFSVYCICIAAVKRRLFRLLPSHLPNGNHYLSLSLSLSLSVLHPINKHLYSGHSHFSAGWNGYFRGHHKSFISCPLFYLSYSYFSDELCFEFPHDFVPHPTIIPHQTLKQGQAFLGKCRSYHVLNSEFDNDKNSIN